MSTAASSTTSPTSGRAKPADGASTRAKKMPDWARHLIVTGLAILVALLVGTALIASQGVNPLYAYQSLLSHAWLDAAGLQTTFARTAVLTFTGLAVAIPLRVGLFNIGAQGQLLAGAMLGATFGIQLSSLPAPVLIPLCLLGGLAGGAFWGWLAGVLRAYRGVHEVISTIMLNYIAMQLIDWLLNGPMKAPGQALPQTARLSKHIWLGSLGPVTFGFLIALVIAILMWWMLRRTVLGFEFQTAGANPDAARYAGIRLPSRYSLAMMLGGALAGLGGAVQTLGETHYFQAEFAGTLGFDGITVALLARNNPLGCLVAAFGLATLRAGAPGLQFETGISPEIVDLLLAIVLALVSIPILGQLLFKQRTQVGATAIASTQGEVNA